MALEVTGIALWLDNHAALLDRFSTTEDGRPHVFVVPGYTTVGAVIAARTRNRIGWLFLGFGLLAALMVFTSPYHDRGVLIAPGSLPAADVVGQLGSVAWPAGFLFLGLLLLLFPDGRLPSPRWRPAALAFVGSWGLVLLVGLFEPPHGTWYGGIPQTNPLAIAALGHPAAKAVGAGALVVAQISLAAMALAPLQRFRRADQAQRQQLKWFAFVVGACFVCGLAAAALRTVLPTVSGALAAAVVFGVLVGLPVAVGVAILRYRLYDIDRLISRALVYASLTVVLGLGYGGLVLALGQLFGTVGERTPSLAVAAATLAVAALFQPARRRLQQLVDRRFNRRRYDAAKTIAAFSARLRDQIDLDTLAAELHTVVNQTMQPTQASLWLRPAPSAGVATPTGQPPQ
jgi:hypothetical protein